MTAFTDLVDRFLAGHFRLDPLAATHAGVHDYDDRWPDWTTAGVEERLDWARGMRRELDELPDGGLSGDERIDRDRLRLVLDDLEYEARSADDAWQPLDWVYRLGDGIFALIARDFAPPAARVASLAARLEGLPGVIEAAKERIGSLPDLAPSRLHTDIALLNLDGIGDLIGEGLALADANAADAAVTAGRARLDRAAEQARAALHDFRDHLRHVVLPTAEGEGRLGPDRFRDRLARTFSDESMTPERVLEAAEAQYPRVRAEMVRLARELWPAWKADAPMPDDDGDVVREVIAAVSIDHPAAPDLLEACRAELQRIEAFCRERDVIGLAEEPLEIQWTPTFLRSFAGAMLHSPGPFDKGQKAFFSITPPADDWAPERVESMLREHNRRQLTLLTIHEAVPGHYLQGVYGNRAPSVVRSVFGSGVYAEGWAVYVTHVMLDLGFDADDPALWLMHWKYYLRAVVNAIIDVRIHTLDMTRDEAISLMVDGAFQEDAEANGKFDRARLSSTQLSTYFIGSMEMWALEDEARRRAARASGPATGDAVVPEPAIVGGYGDTPGFDSKTHLESVIGVGELPLPLLHRPFGSSHGGAE
jgi:uncharacterized protein (DUF885 family)